MKRQIAIVMVSVAMLAGCSSTEQGRRAGTGALVGAAGGALVGQAIGRDTTSTLIGAAAGSVIGAGVGAASTPEYARDTCRYRDRYGRYYTAPCDDRY
jgi:hypothetical protein